jgi:hypothetical protein
MYFGIRKHEDSAAVHLQSAVLCMDCECVTEGRSEECPVCGSHALFSVARILDGALVSHKTGSPKKDEKDESVVRFDLKIAVEVKDMGPRDLNAIIEGIANVISPRLGKGSAGFRINVEPVGDSLNADWVRAA